MPIEMNSFRGIARLDASLAEAKNHLASDLISASPLRSTLRSMRREGGGGRLSFRPPPLPRPGTDSPLFRNDKNPISSGTVAWKEGHDAFLPGWRVGRRETLIEATDKMPPQASYFSGIVVESARLWETFVEFRPNFPRLQQGGKGGAFEFEFFPLSGPQLFPLRF